MEAKNTVLMPKCALLWPGKSKTCASWAFRSAWSLVEEIFSVAKWLPKPLVSLGTDGFGRSESRAALRDFFEVDAKHIVFAALGELAREGKIKLAVLDKAKKNLGINSDKPNPLYS